MPIYAYRCADCGFAKDVLQKVSDAPLSQCPSCSKATFKKQLTAAGFQLKGTGWYVTDFRGGAKSAPASEPPKAEGKTEDAASKPAASAATPASPAAPATPTTPSS